MIIERDDLLMEQIAEEIDATNGPFDASALTWTGEGHWARMHAVVDGLEAAGLLRRLDLRDGVRHIRTDIPCPISEPVLTVYRAWGADDALLYVGCTSKALKLRIRHHAKTKDWWPLVVRVTEQPVIGWLNGLATERAAIEAEAPRFNVIHNPSGERRQRRLRQVSA